MRARPRASRAGGRFHAPRRSLRSRPFMRSGIATDGTIARRLGGQSRRRPCRTRRHAARTASAAVRSCSQETATDGTVARAGSRGTRPRPPLSRAALASENGRMEAKLLSTHGQDVDLPGSTGLRRFRLWDQGTHGGTGFGGTTSDHAKLNHVPHSRAPRRRRLPRSHAAQAASARSSRQPHEAKTRRRLMQNALGCRWPQHEGLGSGDARTAGAIVVDDDRRSPNARSACVWLAAPRSAARTRCSRASPAEFTC